MSCSLDQLPPRLAPDPTLLHAVVETLKGRHNMPGDAPELGRFKLNGGSPQGHRFAYGFGFGPATKVVDGDPLDVLLRDAPTFRDA
jgi:inorganic pyrophosphatase